MGLTLLINFIPNYYPSGQVGYTLFYLAIFLIACQLKGKKLNKHQVCYATIFVIFSYVLMFNCYREDIFYAINKQKFPPRLPYIVWSFLSLLLVFVFYNRLKINQENFITFIGKNAIFFYFAQGLSSSLVYFIVHPFKEDLHWFLLMVSIFIINAIMAFFFAKLLKRVDRFGWNILEYLRKKTEGRNFI